MAYMTCTFPQNALYGRSARAFALNSFISSISSSSSYSSFSSPNYPKRRVFLVVVECALLVVELALLLVQVLVLRLRGVGRRRAR
ncbi:hypothetical protein LXL04_029477 [Taraxacum kok-saghyz]